MFERIRGTFDQFRGLKKRLKYEAEKQLALTFYSDIALIFSFDDKIPKLCKQLNDLIRADRNYNKLEECKKVNNEINNQIHRLEFHNRKARIWLKKKVAIIEKVEAYLKKKGAKKLENLNLKSR